MSDKQVQKAGNNAQQMQAEIINITNVSGIDEKRAREIFNEMYAIARKDFTQDAYRNKAPTYAFRALKSPIFQGFSRIVGGVCECFILPPP